MAELRSSSPDGRYNIRVYPWEARMSHWIETPELLDTLSGAVLIGFADSNWSLNSAHWQSTSVVQLSLRKYPGDHTPLEFRGYRGLPAPHCHHWRSDG